MTIQNLFIAELADILQIQLECVGCGAQISYGPDKPVDVPELCPQRCGQDWKDRHKPEIGIQIIESFLQVVAEARKQQRIERRIKVKLVFDHEPQWSDE